MSDDLIEILLEGLGQTLYMVIATTIIANLVGFVLGIIMVITDKSGIWPHLKLNKVLGTIINAIRSVPEIILIVILIPLTRLIVGTSLGTTATIVPLSIGMAPYLARIYENSLRTVERGKIEAALSMGANQFQIISKVIVPEALPSLIRGFTLGLISIIGATAVAGATGAGGLGDLAIRFGYQRYRTDVLFSTVVIIVLLVQGVQFLGDFSARQVNKKRYKFE
ncbi:MAG: methionine ABC transporter permease [Clostridium sp.]|uniref:methionine ABC transporter permease n=1 Tax=Clostridium sp. TaxID=1506 RepID=UPI0039ED75D8